MMSPSSQALCRPIAQTGVDVFSGLVVAVDGQELGLDLLAVDPRGRIAVDAEPSRGHAACRKYGWSRRRRSPRRKPTEPSTVTSPSVNMIDWPERTGLSSSRERGFGLASGLGFDLLRFILDQHGGAPTGQQGRHAGGEVIGVDPSMPRTRISAPLEASEQVCDGGLAEFHGGQVEHDRLADKEAGRARQRGVDFLEPAHNRDHGEKTNAT